MWVHGEALFNLQGNVMWNRPTMTTLNVWGSGGGGHRGQASHTSGMGSRFIHQWESSEAGAEPTLTRTLTAERALGTSSQGYCASLFL